MSSGVIDLRSDTVTRPTASMRRAIAEAEVGDDVFGEDPSVNELQETLAELLGKQASLFVPSGVMANQLAIKAQTQPGEEVIVERDSHILNYETAAPSLLSGVQLMPLQGTRGVLRAEEIAPAIRPAAYYLPRTALVCLENTHNRGGGTIYPIEQIRRIREFTRAIGVKMHLDGARLWNAWVATGIHPREYAQYFETVSVCFSKGLGAPVGSALAGPEEVIQKARRFRKIFGGGMRQAGMMAAGALYALRNHVERLKEDHEKARVFAAMLAAVRSLRVDPESVQTNIVIVDVEQTGRSASDVVALLRSQGILLTEAGYTAVRAVTHMDVTMEETKYAAGVMMRLFSN